MDGFRPRTMSSVSATTAASRIVPLHDICCGSRALWCPVAGILMDNKKDGTLARAIEAPPVDDEASERWHKPVAVALVISLHALFLQALWLMPSMNRVTHVEPAKLRVRWIEVPPASEIAAPLSPAALRADARVSPARRGNRQPAPQTASTLVTSLPLAQLALNLSLPDAARTLIIPSADRQLIQAPQRTVEAYRFRMEDSSWLGQLSAMSRHMDCSELRAATAKASGSSLDVIERSMRARGC